MSGVRDDIMQSAVKGVRIYGFEGLRMNHIADLAGISKSNLYSYFASKEELLRLCFESVDRQIANLFAQMKFSVEQIKENPEEIVFGLWTTYFKWLTSHPDETVFYFAYRNMPSFPEYDKTRDVTWFANFVEIFYRFDDEYKIYEQVPPQVLWTHIVGVTVFYAKLVVENVLDNDEKTIMSIFKMIMKGLQGVLNA